MAVLRRAWVRSIGSQFSAEGYAESVLEALPTRMVLVQGGDYRCGFRWLGAVYRPRHGDEVKVLNFVESCSTTAIASNKSVSANSLRRSSRWLALPA